MRKRKKKSILRLLNPKNLQREVNIYGYSFSWKNQILILISALAGMAALSILFKLSYISTIIVLSMTIIILPALILDTYKRMYEQKRFADVSTYIEQLMYSFQKSEKVKTALLECSEIFNDGEMKTSIDDAVAYINAGKSETEMGFLKEALLKIEDSYPCKKLRTAHELLISVEKDGGEARNSITLILEDTENWKRRCYKLQAEKKQSHTNNIVSIMIATLLCAMCLYVLEYIRIFFSSGSMTSIFELMPVQITSTVFIIFSMYLLKKSSGSLTNDWIVEDKLYEDDKIRRTWQEAEDYDEKKESKKSIVLSAPFFIAIIPVYIWWKKWVCIPLLLIAIFFLMHHKLGYRLVKKELHNALYIAFPQWLMEMALLLQNNNVQVSIIKSKQNVPAVLEKELDKLIDRLSKEPDRLSTYTAFCENFNLPEAQSCMKMLHSISESGVGDAGTQIANLLTHINKMQDQADNLVNENIAFKMNMIFGYPIGAAAIKMLIDLTLGMMLLFQIMGSMGGY